MVKLFYQGSSFPKGAKFSPWQSGTLLKPFAVSDHESRLEKERSVI